jgi:folate-binding protein YgfZ
MPSRTTRSITLSGPDAAAFANAQFGSAVLALGTGQWQWSGWLDPKGRVRALLQVARPGDERFVVIPRGGDAAMLAADLSRFVFRSKVKIAVSEPLHVSNGDSFDDMRVLEDGDVMVLGEGDGSLRIGDASGDDAWCARHIEKGFAWLPDEAIDMLLPPALSMERLGAVAFDKGCFPGQEIAARLHFLGGHKKHLRVVRSDVGLGDGESIRIDGRDVGIVLMCNVSQRASISLVVLDDAVVEGDTLETGTTRLHVLSTFDA